MAKKDEDALEDDPLSASEAPVAKKDLKECRFFVWSKREYLFEKQFEIHSLAIKPHSDFGDQ